MIFILCLSRFVSPHFYLLRQKNFHLMSFKICLLIYLSRRNTHSVLCLQLSQTGSSVVILRLSFNREIIFHAYLAIFHYYHIYKSMTRKTLSMQLTTHPITLRVPLTLQFVINAKEKIYWKCFAPCNKS